MRCTSCLMSRTLWSVLVYRSYRLNHNPKHIHDIPVPLVWTFPATAGSFPNRSVSTICLRNNLLNGDFSFGKNKEHRQRASFRDMKDVYYIDASSKTTRCFPKLFEVLKPNAFNGMSVKLAAQVLSHSVAAARRTAINTQQLTSTTAVDTSQLLEAFNETFDKLNSRNLNDPGSRLQWKRPSLKIRKLSNCIRKYAEAVLHRKKKQATMFWLDVLR